MPIIPYEHVQVPTDRQRQTFEEDKLEELAKSIEENGLFHAPVVDAEHKLVAGERRYRAIGRIIEKGKTFYYNGRDIGDGQIPVTYTHATDELTLQEIELYENLHREDLPWQEEKAAVAKLHDLRIKQYGEYDPTTKEGWTIAKTAAELQNKTEKEARGYQSKQVSDALLISKHLDNPFIAEAKDAKDAIKRIKELDKDIQREAKAKEVLLEGINHTLLHGDALQILAELPHEKFSTLVTDPPYGISAHTFNEAQQRNFDDSPEVFKQLMNDFFPLLRRVMAEQAHIYIFCDLRFWKDLANLALLYDFHPWKVPLIWDKGHIGNYGGIEYGPRHTYDCILYANRGKKQVNQHKPDVISISGMQKTDHPDQKPVALYENLLSRSVSPGDYVLDPFCGSGTIFAAAENQTCFATGIEQDDAYHIQAKCLLGSL